MNELMTHAIKIFDDSLEDLTGSDSVERVRKQQQLAQGYIVGLRLLSLITDKQYSAMDTLLEVAVDAVKQRIEKASSGVGSTEEGSSKEGCPAKDNSLSHTFSIAIIGSRVKGNGESLC